MIYISVFSGEQCEIAINGCYNQTEGKCSASSSCRAKAGGGYDCLCPISGNYAPSDKLWVLTLFMI